MLLSALLLGAAMLPAAAQDPAPEGPRRRLVVMVEDRALESWEPLCELARAFEREHPGLEVQVLDQAGAVGQQDKARFLLAGDLQLDVTRIDVTELGAFLAEGALVDLKPWLEADPTWNEGAYLDVLEGARGPDGHLYGLPSTFTPYVMYFNRDLLRACGAAEPRAGWTWDDLLEACRRTTRDLDGDGRTDQWGISLTQWLQAVAPWVWQNGGDLLEAGARRSRLREPAAVEAFRFLRRLLHGERLASFDASFENQLSQGLFQAGRAAFYGPVGYWETYRFKRIRAFEWDVAPLPRGRAEATAIAMTVFVVPRTARQPELACRFVQRLAGEEYQRMLARIGNGVPGLRAAALSESFLKPDVAPASERVFLEVLPGARFLPGLVNWRKIESLVQADLSEVLLAKECDVEAACARMARRTDEYLERERGRRAKPPLARWAMFAAVSAALLACAALVLARGRRQDRRARPAEERAAALLLFPWALGFAAFFVGPAAVALVLSFCEWSPLRTLEDVRWAGAENWARLGDDPTFATSLRATSLYAGLSVPLSLALALALALLARADSRGASALRTVLYLPTIVAPVVVAAVWRFLLDDDRGLFNRALAALGIAGPPWLRDSGWVLVSFVAMGLWGVGAQMLVFVAALKALDLSVEEAARIDGAGAWQRFLHVTLPALTPVLLFNLVIGLLQAAQIFAQPYVLTQGGPGDASRFLVLYLYESGFRHLDLGYASAIAWALFAALAVLVGLAMWSARRWVHYAARPRAGGVG